MVEGLTHLADNALSCLDIKGPNQGGQELVIIYNGSDSYKTQLAEAIKGQALRASISVVRMRDIDQYFRNYENNDRLLAELNEGIAYRTNNPLERNAINLLPLGGRYDKVRKRVTQNLMINKKAYVLQVPFSKQETAEAIFSIDPDRAEEVALRMKADLDRASEYMIESSPTSVLQYPVNPNLSWVVSVGKIKKYSPLGPQGESIGGWGNPPGEIFTSFANEPRDYEAISGELLFDAFTLGHALNQGEFFHTEINRGRVNTDIFARAIVNMEISHDLRGKILETFLLDEWANCPGELGLGLVKGFDLATERGRSSLEGLTFEKIAGTLHVGFGDDENERGTGGFVKSKAHNDCGISRPRFEAKIDNKWVTILDGSGNSPYF
ncbi:MAG: hypothetical protein AABY05_03760 [Nanoarchaeota archaeon]